MQILSDDTQQQIHTVTVRVADTNTSTATAEAVTQILSLADNFSEVFAANES